MKIIFSLDYELFFGEKSGTVENCLITPTNILANLFEQYGVKMSLFVDIGFLIRLREEGRKYRGLLKEYDAIQRQLETLIKRGHDVQLHIHTHWEDSHFNGNNWQIDTSRYKLHDFDDNDLNHIIASYKTALVDIVGESVFAYRAGGWCLQPFRKLSNALRKHGIWIDSTVFQNGTSSDPIRYFDFSHIPNSEIWRFDDDPLIEKENGYFLEIPITSYKVMPSFFWKLAFHKKVFGKKHKPFGDGVAMQAITSYYLERLTRMSYSVVSIDSYKVSLLRNAYLYTKNANKTLFNVMGHPKMLTPYSLIKLREFLEDYKGEIESITYQYFVEKQKRISDHIFR